MLDSQELKVFRSPFFLEEGQISNHIAFVEKGLAMYYKIVDGTEY